MRAELRELRCLRRAMDDIPEDFRDLGCYRQLYKRAETLEDLLHCRLAGPFWISPYKSVWRIMSGERILQEYRSRYKAVIELQKLRRKLSAAL